MHTHMDTIPAASQRPPLFYVLITLTVHLSTQQEATDASVIIAPIQRASAAIFHFFVAFLLVWVARIFLISFVIIIFFGWVNGGLSLRYSVNAVKYCCQ